jgi:hypothetical protein
MDNNLAVKSITKADLRVIVSTNEYWKQGLAPFTRSKASWLVTNKRIDDLDYCGVMATENNKMVAFLNFFPDLINTPDINKTKVYWMNDWWIHDDYKESILGSYVYSEALKLANNQVLIKAYSENVHAFYKKQPYRLVEERLRYTLFFSLDASMFLGKFTFLKPFKWLLDITDSVSGYFIKNLNKLKLKKGTQDLKYDYINRLDDDTWGFIEQYLNKDLIYKTKDYIDWHLDKNQYNQTPIIFKRPFHNLLAGASYNIEIHKVKIMYQNRVIGFLSYVLNYKEFNIKYFITENNEQSYVKCIDALMQHIVVSNCNFVFTDDTNIYTHLKKQYTIFYTHKVIKRALAHKDLKCDISGLQLQEQDGHFY